MMPRAASGTDKLPSIWIRSIGMCTSRTLTSSSFDSPALRLFSRLPPIRLTRFVREVNDSIQRFGSGCNPKTNAGDHSLGRGDVDPLMRTLEIAAKLDSCRMSDRMRQLPTTITIN